MADERHNFEISRWACWPATSGASDRPDLGFVAPLLRRRLSRLAAAALAVAHECLGERKAVPIVLASRHGELNRTGEILVDLARGEAPSPAAFSLSVHNSATGLLGLARKDRAPSTAIAAGDLTVAMGLLEAIAQAADSGGSALLIIADERTPALYADTVSPPARDFALAMLITLDGGTYSLGCSTASGEAVPGEQAEAVRALLAGKTARAALGDASQCWTVTRNAAAA